MPLRIAVLRNTQTLLGSIKPMIHRIQPFANFCTLKNPNPPDKGLVISYLVNSCGLSPATAASASKKVHFDSPGKPDAMIDFLRQQGFTRTQIADLVRGQPNFLVSDPDKSLLPKIEFFSRLAENDVLATLSRHPYLMRWSLDRLSAICDYLKAQIGPEKLEALFRRGSGSLVNFDLENRVIPNVELLREAGVPQSGISLALFQFPSIFTMKQVDFLKTVGEVKGMGLDPQKVVFVLALSARTGKRKLALWDKCSAVYSKWGWSAEDILVAVRRHPNSMLCSEEKIERVLGFVTKELGREARSVARTSNIIFFSMEKRIVPRCSVVRLLASKGLVKSDWSLGGVLGCVEKDFMERYVSRYSNELPELHDFYLSMKTGAVESQPPLISCIS